MDPDSSTCPFCREAIRSSAIKCYHCGEFLPTVPLRKQKVDTGPFWTAFFGFAGKALLPAALIALAVLYMPEVRGLLPKVRQAEFLGTKLVFSETRGYTGELTPIELYYLLGSAENYGKKLESMSALNLPYLRATGKMAAIDSLVKKGLITATEVQRPPPQGSNEPIRSLLSTAPTENGKSFLIDLGLKLTDGAFNLAP